jgi:hypothetical protein
VSEELERLLSGLAPADVVPRAGRPSREAVLELLALDGQQVTIRDAEVIEDVDGIPSAITTTTTTATMVVNPELLGWTWAELGIHNPSPEEDHHA